MTDVNARLAEILAEYTAMLDRIERPARQDGGEAPHSGRVLLPADQQRVSRAPVTHAADDAWF